jgi:tetratricopeptide (TPR) repeat protein
LTVPDRTGPVISPAPASPETGDTLSYSRTIRGTTGQVLEVPFRGTGWVYLGEANAGRGISYLSRRADPEGQTFIFRLDEIGEYELRFYKQDFIRDYILNDHVRVIVEDGPKGNSFFYPEEPARLVAEPRWPPPENPAGRTDSNGVSPSTDPLDEQSPETAAAGQGAAAPETMAGQGVVAPETAAAGQDTAAPETAELLPAALLGRAREAYEAGRFPDALAALDEFRLKFPLGSDEAWWLYGQLLESAGPRRDIRGALEYYRRLIREYPQSPRCDDARKRIAYLERFYFNIR